MNVETNKKSMKNDHLTVKEKANIESELSKRERDLIEAAYKIDSIVSLAHFRPQDLVRCMDIEKYPGENFFALTDQQLKDFLFDYDIDLSLQTINEILEIGYQNAQFGKWQRKNEKGEFICNAWVISGL
jgi:hypothetical protein